MSRLPAGSWDTHLHVFGPTKDYPSRSKTPLYAPPEDCDQAAMEKVHGEIGIDHAILIQPTAYGSDHRLMERVLTSSPSGKYVGVAIIDDDIDDTELKRLHKAGVRGARFNFGSKFKMAPSPLSLQRNMKRVADLGWFVKVFGYGDDFLTVEEELLALACPAIIDHIGGFDPAKSTSAAGFQFLIELLKRKNWWGLLSNGDNRLEAGPPWDDAVPFGKLFYDTAPDRCIWGSDWPHLHRLTRPSEHTAHEDIGANYQLQRLALLRRYLPDEAAFRKVLVDNPAALIRSVG